jgi:hypothetical protein
MELVGVIALPEADLHHLNKHSSIQSRRLSLADLVILEEYSQ